MPRLRRALVTSALAAAWLVVVQGCAKKGAPSGGPPDVEPPRVIGSQPDSGAARVPRDAALSLTFSEGMEPRSSGDAVALSPPAAIRRLKWSGRTVTVELADSLRANQTYTLFIGQGARDRHGNPMEAGATVVFTTADSFPAGRIAGQLDARGFSGPGTFLWCYDEARGHRPDSTGGDFDAVGLVDVQNEFRVGGLAVPGSYRVWVFVDQNGNRSFEPERDVLARVDTLIALTPAAPTVTGLTFRIVNPRAPARVKGTVIDSLADREGDVFIAAFADTDTTRRVIAAAGDRLQFEIQLDPGSWTLRAFRDLDRNRTWDRARESASRAHQLKLGPADAVEGLVLDLQPAARAP